MIACISSALYFNPHLPCGRRLDIKFYLDRYEAFQSTPSLRKATFIVIPLFLVEIFQSTPSLRKATIPAYDRYSKVTFQSTPSLRKATVLAMRSGYIKCISIHTFLAEGDLLMILLHESWNHFNPHLPCGRRRSQKGIALSGLKFQSTPSLRKATPTATQKGSWMRISIHTFLAEGDR